MRQTQSHVQTMVTSLSLFIFFRGKKKTSAASDWARLMQKVLLRSEHAMTRCERRFDILHSHNSRADKDQVIKHCQAMFRKMIFGSIAAYCFFQFNHGFRPCSERWSSAVHMSILQVVEEPPYVVNCCRHQCDWTALILWHCGKTING